MRVFMAWVPPFGHYDGTPRLPVTKVASPCPDHLHAWFVAIPLMRRVAAERLAHRGQRHQIPCHLEAGGVTEVVPSQRRGTGTMASRSGAAWRTDFEKSTVGSPA